MKNFRTIAAIVMAGGLSAGLLLLASGLGEAESAPIKAIAASELIAPPEVTTIENWEFTQRTRAGRCRFGTPVVAP